MALLNNSTIQSVIDDGLESKLSIRELSLKEIITNSSGEKFVINMFNLYERYYDILLDHVVTVTTTEKEYRRYRFNPKLLSYDLYGTQELHYMLLRLNYVYSVINFDFHEIKVFKQSVLPLLNEIIVLESENYIENEVSIIKKLNE